MSKLFTDVEIAEMHELALTCRPVLGKSLSEWQIAQLFAGWRLATMMAGNKIAFGIKQVTEELPKLLLDYPWPDDATA